MAEVQVGVEGRSQRVKHPDLPLLSTLTESTRSQTTGESRCYPPGDVSLQDTESAKKDMDGEEEGGMGKQSDTSTDPFPLRTQRHSQVMLQTCFEKTHPPQSGRCSGSHCVLRNQWSCPQAVTALMNRAEANGELRSISHLKRLTLTIVY